MGKLVFFICVWLIFFFIDLIGNPCLQKRLDVWPIIIFHHFIWTYALLGWIFDDPVFLIIHILLPVAAFCHWTSGTGRCFVNEVTEEYCGTEVEPFRKMDNIFGIPDYVYNTIVGFGVAISVYKIYRYFKCCATPRVRWGMKPCYLEQKLKIPKCLHPFFDS